LVYDLAAIDTGSRDSTILLRTKFLEIACPQELQNKPFVRQNSGAGDPPTDNIAKKLEIPIIGLDLLKSGGSLIVANEIRESTDRICKALEKINKNAKSYWRFYGRRSGKHK
jgi:hypothetical protein